MEVVKACEKTFFVVGREIVLRSRGELGQGKEEEEEEEKEEKKMEAKSQHTFASKIPFHCFVLNSRNARAASTLLLSLSFSVSTSLSVST